MNRTWRTVMTGGVLVLAAFGVHGYGQTIAPPVDPGDSGGGSVAAAVMTRKVMSDVSRHETDIRFLKRAVADSKNEIADLRREIDDLKNAIRDLQEIVKGGAELPVDQKAWLKLRAGMSADEVKNLLGIAWRVTLATQNTGEIWYYYQRGAIYFDWRGRVLRWDGSSPPR